ncbi:autotransporter-associated beta strand repeat-containing protein [Polynucleobacter necessarius]|uniref:autotransporter-associated beta strand repeat-containing protein n=1 Tax=Polynucleobacter necessarius TaxID=576610 RepID=UPI000E0911F0|nr:autotransporter-associated beta strand repeat-containing protein [Polynucleobacter necessarius]
MLILDGGVSGITFAAEALTISGSGIGSAGVIHNLAGDNTLAGANTLNANFVVTTANASSPLRFTGTINGAYDLTINSEADVQLNGVVGGSAALASITTDADGRTLVGANINTVDAQLYNDEVVASGAITFTSAGITSSITNILTGRTSESFYATSSGSSPNGESARKAFDANVDSKYLNFAKAGSDVLIDAGTSYVVTGLGLSTANDSNGRDPASYSLYGSNTAFVITQLTSGNDSNIASGGLPDAVLISSGSLAPPTDRKTAYPTISFSNSTGYRYYRLVFDTIRASGSDAMQVSEIRLPSQSSSGSGSAITFAQNLTVNNNVTISSAGTVTAANIQVSGTLSISNGGSASVTRAIGDGSSAASLVKSGSGTLTLSGPNTYTGTTSVSAGTLALGASNVIADASAVTVNGGTLALGSYSDTVGL